MPFLGSSGLSSVLDPFDTPQNISPRPEQHQILEEIRFETYLVAVNELLTVLSMYPRVGIFFGDEAIPMLFLRSRGISSLFDPCDTPRTVCSTRLALSKHYRRAHAVIKYIVFPA